MSMAASADPSLDPFWDIDGSEQPPPDTPPTEPPGHFWQIGGQPGTQPEPDPTPPNDPFWPTGGNPDPQPNPDPTPPIDPLVTGGGPPPPSPPLADPSITGGGPAIQFTPPQDAGLIQDNAITFQDAPAPEAPPSPPSDPGTTFANAPLPDPTLIPSDIATPTFAALADYDLGQTADHSSTTFGTSAADWFTLWFDWENDIAHGRQPPADWLLI
jgi:hypothetical protein